MTTTTETIRRINLNRVSPEVYEAMRGAEHRGRRRTSTRIWPS